MAYHVANWKCGNEACKDILGLLEKDGVTRVILFGEAGTGKTWMARQISHLATKEGSCYITLRLTLSKDFDEMSLYEDIASQLSLFFDYEESEEDDSEDEADQQFQDLITLKAKIHDKLKRKKCKRENLNNQENQYLLLVLDDAESVTSETKLMKDLHLAEFLAPVGPLKILFAKRKGEENNMDESQAFSDAGEIDSPNVSLVQSDDEEEEIDSPDVSLVHSDDDEEIKPLDDSHVYVDRKIKSHATAELPTTQIIDISRDSFTDDYFVYLLRSLIEDGLLENLEKAWRRDNRDLEVRIVERSMRLPAAIVLLAKSLLCLSPKQKELLQIGALLSECEEVTTFTSKPNPILHLAYELLKTDHTLESPILDCFWHSLSYFQHCGCVYYQELIAHWILEGYFDPVTSVTKAYKDGHKILMELMNRGFLKIQEDNVVKPEVAMKDLIDLRRLGLSSATQIGLSKVFGKDRTKSLGKTNQVDDIIQAVQSTRKGEIITTLLVSGNRLRRETPEKYFKKLKDLEVLGLFSPTLEPFVQSLSELVKLRVLVIRDCDLLENIEELKALRELHVLQISGASSLKKISDDFFKALKKLQSLHLSGLQITSSPSSISQLMELHCLIIKDCPLLEDLPDIQELTKLEVVDVSGARGLQTCFDNTNGERKNNSKNKNFYHLEKLQLLDISESQIDRLPMFQDAMCAAKLHSLTRLLLRDCRKLRKLPNLKPLSGLQILDLSGSTSLVKVFEVCFEDKKELRILNLSRTSISEFATTIEELSNLKELLLKDCTNLEVLPNIQKLTDLEIIDVSGCTKLHTIEGSFEEMPYLREVNLAGTKVTILPEFLPKESKIRCLKRITLANGRYLERENWEEVNKAMASETSENASSSTAVVESQEISEEIEKKGDVSKERLLKVPVDKNIYKNVLLSFAFESPDEVMEINETSELDGEALANVVAVNFVEFSSQRLTSIFNKINSVKYCWLRVSLDTNILFSGVDEERLGSLETLSITNLPLLETISLGGSFKNLKKLYIDCCPNIKTLFLDMLMNLEVVHIKFCEELEEVVGGVELSTLTKLVLKVENCPKCKETSIGSDWFIVDRTEASPQD